eukprot:CAMPEP_0180729070 /NCGR_PEP_ID=MMETSP1038_2-20121128/19914_1 /TAXON_ID=632150 /ORGANISM="Azadinium spinosum, Strain 3D9" /LENGTH=383 /DNA_ID=CAMNT_0022761787 /DNA_START=32 /DNA_END=1183 /DNA_ORIENTATION=-
MLCGFWQRRSASCSSYVAKGDLFAPLVRSFEDSLRPPGLGGNLLVSAVLELLEFIRTENIKVLVDHMCTQHKAVLMAQSPRFKTLRDLLQRHQQNLDLEAAAQGRRGGSGGAGADAPLRPGTELRSPGREDSDDEEPEVPPPEENGASSLAAGPAAGDGTAEALCAEAAPEATPVAPEPEAVASPKEDEALALSEDEDDEDEERTRAMLKGLLGSYEEEEEELPSVHDGGEGKPAWWPCAEGQEEEEEEELELRSVYDEGAGDDVAPTSPRALTAGRANGREVIVAVADEGHERAPGSVTAEAEKPAAPLKRPGEAGEPRPAKAAGRGGRRRAPAGAPVVAATAAPPPPRAAVAEGGAKGGGGGDKVPNHLSKRLKTSSPALA